jgi:CheY-like chemotaxis protein
VGGWSVLRVLREEPGLREIPLILVHMMDALTSTYELGVVGYLHKPIDGPRVNRLLSRYLGEESEGPLLIVDDDRVTLEIMRRRIEKAGYTVCTATNGIEALRCVEERQPALIFLDLMMPEMDGFTFFSELRKREERGKIPVVFVSSVDLTEESELHFPNSFEPLANGGLYEDPDFLERLRDRVVLYLDRAGTAFEHRYDNDSSHRGP